MFDLKTNVLICGLFVHNDEISNSSWPGIWPKFDRVPEHQLRSCQDVVWYLFEADFGKFIQNSVFIYDYIWLLSVDENGFVPWSSDQMGDSKGTCLFWFSSVSSKNKSSFRSKHQVERTDSVFPTIQRVRRIFWNWWRTNWVRVEYFPRIHIEKDLNTRRKNPDQLEEEFYSCRWLTTLIGHRNSSECISSVREVSDHAKECQWGHWSFLSPGDDRVARNLQLQARRKIRPASQSVDWCMRTEWSSRIPRQKCA